MTADEKYSLLIRGNLLQHFQMHLSQKRKIFSPFFFIFFFYIFQTWIQFWKFSKKWLPSYVMYFSTWGLRKTCLDKCLKSPLSEVPSTSNMVNEPKHSWNLKHSTFTIFIDAFEEDWGCKRLSEWYVKSSDFLLTHWHPMTSIFFLTQAIYCNNFRCNYLRSKKNFPIFFYIF